MNNLVKMNELNHEFYNQASYVTGSIYGNEYLTSHTDFAIPDYGNSPFKFVNNLGVTEEGWEETGKITVLRAAVMTPYMNKEENFDYFAPKIKQAMQEKLEAIYEDRK